MSTLKTKRKKVFSATELERAKAELIEKRLGILPIEVTESGYYYNPHELFNALEEKPDLLNEHKNKQ